MSRDIRESDWKILKQLHPIALERFCQRVFQEVDGITSEASETFHQRYLALYKIVERRDKEMESVFGSLRRSTALLQIAALRSRGLLEDEEFVRFSEEVQGDVAVFLDGRA